MSGVPTPSEIVWDQIGKVPCELDEPSDVDGSVFESFVDVREDERFKVTE